MSENIVNNHASAKNTQNKIESTTQIEIFGVKINDNRSIFAELLRVYGIGNSTSEAIVAALGLEKHSRLIDYPNSVKEELIKTTQELQNVGILFGNELRIKIRQDIKTKISSGSYQGRRHAYGQPVRSSNTRSNGKTAKRLCKAYKTSEGDK